MTSPPRLPLLDLEVNLQVLAATRVRNDRHTRALVHLSERFSPYVARHCPDDAAAREAVGLGLVAAAALAGELFREGLNLASVINVLALAGEQIVTDARAGSAGTG